jgi:hypothetical protein
MVSPLLFTLRLPHAVGSTIGKHVPETACLSKGKGYLPRKGRAQYPRQGQSKASCGDGMG